jgi:hypothetical protein
MDGSVTRPLGGFVSRPVIDQDNLPIVSGAGDDFLELLKQRLDITFLVVSRDNDADADSLPDRGLSSLGFIAQPLFRSLFGSLLGPLFRPGFRSGLASFPASILKSLGLRPTPVLSSGSRRIRSSGGLRF